MNTIIPPIRPRDQGPSVTNLQEALLFIVEKRRLTPSNLTLAQWQQALQPETAAQSFGQVTRRLFVGLLTDLSLPNADFVDESIAARLNELLESLGAFLPTPSTSIGRLSVGGGQARSCRRRAPHEPARYWLLDFAARIDCQFVRRDDSPGFKHVPKIARPESTGIVHSFLVVQIKTAAQQSVGSVGRRPWGSDPTAVSAVVRAFDADFRRNEFLRETVKR